MEMQNRSMDRSKSLTFPGFLREPSPSMPLPARSLLHSLGIILSVITRGIQSNPSLRSAPYANSLSLSVRAGPVRRSPQPAHLASLPLAPSAALMISRTSTVANFGKLRRSRRTEFDGRTDRRTRARCSCANHQDKRTFVRPPDRCWRGKKAPPPPTTTTTCATCSP